MNPIPAVPYSQRHATVHRAADRGQADYGWLKARYSFSFSAWHHPDRMGVGALRVLNDDLVAPGRGFGEHPHDNMEIITIPLKGELAHRDNKGGEGLIRAGDVQVMSAGTGIRHSEFNPSRTEPVSLFQIWIFPEKQGVTPRYDQRSFDADGWNGRWQPLVGPLSAPGGHLGIHQQAWILRGRFSGDVPAYSLHGEGKAVYLLVVDGHLSTPDGELGPRDAVAIYGETHLKQLVARDAELLLIEVPDVDRPF